MKHLARQAILSTPNAQTFQMTNRQADSRFSTTSLDQLIPGQHGRIIELVGEAGTIMRLMEMGVLVREDIEMLRIAPLGDPIIVLIRGCRLAVRRRDAALVKVEIVDENQ